MHNHLFGYWASCLMIFIFSLSSLSCEKKAELPAYNIEKIRSAIFKVRVVSQEPRYDEPWLKKSSQRSSGTGFYIGDGRIITNAHVVANAKFITVQKDGDDEPVQALTRFVAHDSDLAILTVTRPNYFDDVKTLELAGLPVLKKSVLTIGYPLGGEQLSVTEGIVSRISFRRYAHSGYQNHLLIQVDSAINSGNSGGPVFQDDRVVGVAFQAYVNAENTGYIIPIPVVKRFLKDVEDGIYDGHPVSGIYVQNKVLEHPLTRKLHGLNEGEGGVKISFVASYSPMKEVLQAGDVITKINGYAIGVDGKIIYNKERIAFLVVYDMAQLGDDIELEILRAGDRQTKKFKVTRAGPHYDRSNRYTDYSKFYIHGGLVFGTLSRDYLKTWGKKWYYKAPLQLRFMHHYSPVVKELEENEDIVILADRLPDFQNRQAEDFMESILIKVNGQKISKISDVASAVESSSEPYLVLEFLNHPQPLVFNREEIAKIHPRLIQSYKVGLDRYFGEPVATSQKGVQP